MKVTLDFSPSDHNDISTLLCKPGENVETAITRLIEHEILNVKLIRDLRDKKSSHD